jgi:hypothetical protein
VPAKNKAQLKGAYAAAGRGEAWGKEMVAKTPRATRSRMMKGKSHSKSKGRR